MLRFRVPFSDDEHSLLSSGRIARWKSKSTCLLFTTPIRRYRPEEIVNENPFYQHKTARQPGCQIDYLIQTKFDTLYVCEIKFSRNEIGGAIIPEIRAKIGALSRPRGMSCRPVLIHVNGVTEEVTDSDYFA